MARSGGLNSSSKGEILAPEGKVVTLKVDQAIARKCYENSLRIRRTTYTLAIAVGPSSPSALDPRLGYEDRRPQLVGGVKEVNMGDTKILKIGDDLKQNTKQDLLSILRVNLRSFAWSPLDMVGIDSNFISHKLNMDTKAKPKVQRRRRMSLEKLEAIREETRKLLTANHIREIQYPEWLANVVMVKKANGKWRMCVDFTDLNNACPKDSYPLPNIDTLVDNASGCGLLSFLDVY